MRSRKLIAAFLLGVGTLGIVFFPSKPALAWSSKVWEINGYIGWEFLDMEREIVFYCEGFSDWAYPFVIEQKEYMGKVQSVRVSELKEIFGASFAPLVVTAYRKGNLGDAEFVVIDITCESDSRIYQGSNLGRFEYQYANLMRVIGFGAHFRVPPEVEYTSFWLLPVQSLTGKVYLQGHTSEKIEYEWNRFRIKAEWEK